MEKENELKDKNKKKINTSSSEKKISKKKNSSKKTVKQIELMQMSNEELLEQILAKKKAKKEKANQNKKNLIQDEIVLPKLKTDESKHRKIVDKNSVETKIVKEVITQESETIQKKAKELKQGLISDKDKVNNELIINIINEEKNIELEIKNDVDDLNQNKVIEFQKIIIEDTKNKKKIKKKFNFKIIIGLFFVIFFLIVGVVFYNQIFKSNDVNNKVTKFIDREQIEKEKEEKEEQLLKEKYDLCIQEPLNINDTSAEINTYIEELNNYLKVNYSTSVSYIDLNLGFEYKYNENVRYYAASTMKSVVALYVYEKADEGLINLDETIVYTSEYKWGASSFMQTHKYGDEITIRDLVKFSIIVSDNSAYQMLVDYVGKSTIREFGSSLGASLTMSDVDNFGYIDVADGIIYMKAINDFINSSLQLGEEFKSYFLEADQNDLAMTDLGISAAHKYGQYNEFYHDIGIVYDEHPYVIAILTREGNKNFEEIVKDINRRVYKLHLLYYQNRDNVCTNLVYGSKKNTQD